MGERGEIDEIMLEFNSLANDYADRARELSSDPYLQQAIVKVSVSSFVWKLYQAFDDDFGRETLLQELIEQTEAVRRAVTPEQNRVH